MSVTKFEGTPRDRLLAAANELFYKEGVHTVGIDRVIERAGVAKASLYSTFGSKEELVRAYLRLRAEGRRLRISKQIAHLENPRDRILAVFDVLGESVADPAYRGCAFMNASAEGPRDETKVTQVCSDWRLWLRSLFTELARDLGAADAEALGRRLLLLYDGATVGASMDRNPNLAADARAMAEALLDAEAAPASRARRRR
jgi:AcrR family transcriptional regulator